MPLILVKPAKEVNFFARFLHHLTEEPVKA
jgi:hypothetical protein